MRAALLLSSLLLLVACGGLRTAGDSAPALTYADPATSGWRLVQDPASTASRLVLALVGPPATKTRGASLTLVADPAQVRWGTFPGGALVQGTGVYVTTTQGLPGESPVLQLVVGGAQDGKLTAGVFQKDRREPAHSSDQALLRIALEAIPGAAPGPVSLVLRKAHHVPDDLAAHGHRPVPMTVTIGKVVIP